MEPRRFAERQLELDRQRTARFPALLARKLGRMRASPLAFLRGAAPLFYELLTAEPDLAAGPAGQGIIQGDAHLENFGAFSPAVHEGDTWKKGHATFQLNDFDEATRGAWRWDVLRLTTSVILAGKGGDEGGWLFDLKEQVGSSVDVLAPRPASVSRAQEVEEAFRSCIDLPPRMLGTSRLAGHDVLVRRLTPQEDKLSLNRLKPADLPSLSQYLGALLGTAHRRGRAGNFQPWSARDLGGILERAVVLAGIHEATYLELCLATREQAATESE